MVVLCGGTQIDRDEEERSARASTYLGMRDVSLLDVSRWISSNRLKLNPLKSELIWLHSSRRNPGFIQNDIELFSNFITTVRVVCNLGVILDENMTMLDHISSVC